MPSVQESVPNHIVRSHTWRSKHKDNGVQRLPPMQEQMHPNVHDGRRRAAQVPDEARPVPARAKLISRHLPWIRKRSNRTTSGHEDRQ